MFYRFNHYMGRIVSSTQGKAYFPQGLKAKVKTSGVPVFHNAVAVQTPDTRVAEIKVTVSGFGNNSMDDDRGVTPDTARYKKIMDLQSAWGEKTRKGEVPYNLSSSDEMVYNISKLVSAIGSLFILYALYVLIFPPGKKTC